MKRTTVISTFVIFAVLVLSAYGFSPYFVSAQHGQHGQGMEGPHHSSDTGMMMQGQGSSESVMPMMHSQMSPGDMQNMCDRMRERHRTMRTTREKNIKKLNDLVESMEDAEGDDKIESMQNLLGELVDQHNRRGTTMMKSMHSMMGSMMNMHRMDSDQRQRMMNEMKNCHPMKGEMGSGHQPGSPSHSDSERQEPE